MGKGSLVAAIVVGAMHAVLQVAVAETPRATGAAAHLSASGRASSARSSTASAPLISDGASAVSSGALAVAKVVATAAGWGGDRRLVSDLAHPTVREAAAGLDRQGKAAGAVIVVAPAFAIAAFEHLAEAARSAASARAAAAFDQPVRVNRGVGSFPE